MPQKFVINKDTSIIFSKCLGSPEFLNKFDDFVRAVDCGKYSDAPHDANKIFSDILIDCAERYLKNTNHNRKNNTRGKPKQKWFDKECKLTQKLFRKSVHKFNAAKTKKNSIQPQIMQDLIKTLYNNKKIFRNRVNTSKNAT